MKNKLYGLSLIAIGVLSVKLCDGDGSFLVFALLLGLGLIFDKVPLQGD